MQLGQRLGVEVKRRLRTAGISQKTLAYEVGCSPKHLSGVLSGRVPASAALWDKIMAASGTMGNERLFLTLFEQQYADQLEHEGAHSPRERELMVMGFAAGFIIGAAMVPEKP